MVEQLCTAFDSRLRRAASVTGSRDRYSTTRSAWVRDAASSFKPLRPSPQAADELHERREDPVSLLERGRPERSSGRLGKERPGRLGEGRIRFLTGWPRCDDPSTGGRRITPQCAEIAGRLSTRVPQAARTVVDGPSFAPSTEASRASPATRGRRADASRSWNASYRRRRSAPA